jgi:hypothetical protein
MLPGHGLLLVVRSLLKTEKCFTDHRRNAARATGRRSCDNRGTPRSRTHRVGLPAATKSSGDEWLSHQRSPAVGARPSACSDLRRGVGYVAEHRALKNRSDRSPFPVRRATQSSALSDVPATISVRSYRIRLTEMPEAATSCGPERLFSRAPSAYALISRSRTGHSRREQRAVTPRQRGPQRLSDVTLVGGPSA